MRTFRHINPKCPHVILSRSCIVSRNNYTRHVSTIYFAGYVKNSTNISHFLYVGFLTYTYITSWWHSENIGLETCVREGVLVEHDSTLAVEEPLPGRVLAEVLLEVDVLLRLLAVRHHARVGSSCVDCDLVSSTGNK